SMFTGIISNLGQLKDKNGGAFTFKASADFCQRISKGTSIAINGACLTAVRKTQQTFTVEVMPETQERTMLGKLHAGNFVNLELPATPRTFLSGHLVQGHIDGVGAIEKIDRAGNSKILTISVAQPISKYIVEKGSIAVNGISLTIISVKPDYFTVGIVAHTWKQTMLNQIKVGDLVNLEVDILAKYLEKLL
ncbi:MAG: riboflavin synthase, partial [Candidatus Doudnabacteria bacterium]|nr:riboflavin synthase [Candidatus Doudnabacteria bacterium]